MSYLLIQNNGEAAIESITMMGASSKRNETDQIGMFGTGNKYALAVLLREGIEVCMFIGEQRIDFVTKPFEMRDSKFNQICARRDGQDIPTGFTVEMGIKWQVDNALREFVSNAIDEGGIKLMQAESLTGEAGTTRFFVGMAPAVQKFLDESKMHFLSLREDAPVFASNTVELWPRTGGKMKAYRRGVLCFTHEKHEGLYDYNFKDVDLAEDRKASESNINFEFAQSVDSLSEPAKRMIIQNIERDTFESQCPDLQYFSLSSGDWKTIADEKIVCSSEVYDFAIAGKANRGDFIRTTEYWAKALVSAGCKSVNDHLSHAEILGRSSVPVDAFEADDLNAAIAFLIKCGYSVSLDQIHIFAPTKKSDMNLMGYWSDKEKKIGLNKACFDKGRQYLTETLLEEVVHRDTSFGDKTLELQQNLFNRLVREMMRRVGSI